MSPLIAALVIAAATPGAPADVPTPENPRGIFLGEDWRYRPTGPLLWTKGLVVRTFSDLIAIPSSVAGEHPAEWIPFALISAATAAALVPVDGRSSDARLQDEIHALRGFHCDNAPALSDVCPSATPSGFHLWTHTSNIAFEGTQVAVPLSLLAVGAIGHHPALVESSTLVIEAYSVALLYHVGIKVLLGREAVLSGNGAGRFHGPSIAFFPNGFPSGHAASMFAIIAVYSTYFDRPWLTALLLAAGTVLAAGLILDDYHFATETVWGAAMGYFIGRWVVQHRSSRFTYDSKGQAVRLEAIAPLAMPGGGSGVALQFSF